VDTRRLVRSVDGVDLKLQFWLRGRLMRYSYVDTCFTNYHPVVKDWIRDDESKHCKYVQNVSI
jgi:hypothetical protein